LAAQPKTRLSPESDKAFDEYTKTVEASLDWRAHITLDKPPPDPAAIKMVPGGAQPTIDLPDAILHDWAAAVLIPGTTLEKTIALMQNYDDYKHIYSRQITDSKLLSHEGDLWRIYLKLYKKAIFTANLHTEHDVEYRRIEPARWGILSRTTKVAEVDDGKIQPVGTGHGFLWRLNAYWVLEQRPEGVYVECRAISMSRDVPTGLGWALKPMVTRVPRESLHDTLEDTVRALAK
jgi:hypothetical protein